MPNNAGHPNRRGFTLIELLIVLMIIAALMGLLIPGIMLVRKQAKKAKAREQIAQIEAACSQYRDTNGIYPSHDAVGGFMTAAGDNSDALRLTLRSVNDAFRLPASVKDPWQNNVRYRPARVYEFSGAGTAIDNEDPPKLESFQVWSFGPDGVDDKGLGDDIPNWKK